VRREPRRAGNGTPRTAPCGNRIAIAAFGGRGGTPTRRPARENRTMRPCLSAPLVLAVLTVSAGGAAAAPTDRPSTPVRPMPREAPPGVFADARPPQGGQDQARLETAIRLHAARQRLAAATAAAERAGFTVSGEAMSPTRQALMQAVRDAWEAVRRAPAGLADTPEWQTAEQALREAFGDTTRVHDDRGGLDAAQRSLAVLDRLQDRLGAAAGGG